MRTYDAIVAGGGLIGSAIALELARNDLRVVLFDAREPGREASWASAGILSPAPENPGMISMVPIGRASLAMYPEFVAQVEELSGIASGYRAKGTVEALFSRHAREELNTIVALHRGLGLQAEAISAKEARAMEPALSEEIEAAVLRPQEASVDNRLLAMALIEAAKSSGAEIHSGAAVEGIWREGSQCRGAVVNGENISAKHTIVAAGSFSAQIAGAAEFAPVQPAKGQMVSLRCEAAKIERVLWSEQIYVVPRNDGRILCGATVEHVGFDRTVTAGGMHANLDAAIALVPVLATAQVEESWAGLRPDTPDHLPIIGPTEMEGLLIATGHFRSGVLLTPITAKLIGEFIAGKTPSVDCERFSPMRFQAAKESARVSGAPR
ncbi:MAG TPA: glycine oxidase ThiO [Candidatus Acidoferrum sp.]|nr:glycine oxidase ThiO [Candidatus Acidoferrum sp.]